MNYTYLQDEAFLKIIDELPVKTHYVRLTVMTLQNKPIAAIEGTTTGGSISVNGSSAIRRTGSLNMIATEDTYKITDLQNLIYMNKKVEVEIGYENQTNLYADYDIIWIPLGIFVMSGANIQKNNQGINISLTLKDQMSLLNGENGGTFETAVTHSPLYVEEVKNGEYVEEYVSFYRLIYELVTEWGKIPPEYVIIDDIPLTIENIVRWIGENNVNIQPINFNDSVIGYTITETDDSSLTNKDSQYGVYSMGDSIGYTKVNYTYPTESDLTSNAGESITSVLDKIKAALGNYEYFFDVHGFFHFQKIKDYQDEGVGVNDLGEALIISANQYLTDSGKSVYDFSTGKLITSYSNAPQWQNVKNDFVVWGKQSDSKMAIRYHLIIDKKPKATFLQKTFYFYQDYFGYWRAVKDKETAQRRVDYVKQKAIDDKTEEETPWMNQTPITSTFSSDLFKANIIYGKEKPEHDWRIQAYFESVLDENAYFYSKELIEEIPKLFKLHASLGESLYTVPVNEFQKGITNNTATYWIDIIDTTEVPALQKFSVSEIGKRTKSVNNDKINCLFDPKFPEIYFIECDTDKTASLRKEYLMNGEPFYQMPEEMYNKIAIGMATNSAYENIRAQIHTLLSFNESVSIGIMPIYHLEPNTRITIEDEDTNIHGDYMIKSFSLPLAASGTMTLQCSKAVERV